MNLPAQAERQRIHLQWSNEATHASRIFADKSLMAREWSHLMTHRVIRLLAVVTSATALVLAGIALNLGILSNRHWGPGGLTLGASGVARSEPSPTTSEIQTPKTTTTIRRAATTSTSSIPPATNSVVPRPFQPDTPTSASFPTETTIVDITDPPGTTIAPTTTTRRKPNPTTTAPALGEPQVFRVATYARATAEFTTQNSLKVTAAVKRGWTVDKPMKTGRDVTMKFRNGLVEVTFHVWIKNGDIQSTSKRVRHDS